MFCPNCGKELPDDSMFCEFCGCRVEGDEADASQGAGNAQSDVAGASQGAGNAKSDEADASQGAGNAKSNGAAEHGANPVLVGVLVLAVILLIGGIYFIKSGKGKTDNSGVQEVATNNQSDDGNSAGAGDADAVNNEDGSKSDASITDAGKASDTAQNVDAGTGTDAGAGADQTEAKEADNGNNSENGALAADNVTNEENAGGAGNNSTGSTDGGTTLITAPASVATLSNFDWYFDEGFPTDGKVLTSLKEVCGEWNSMMKVTTTVDEGERTRLLITDAKISGSEDQLKIVMNLREQVEYMESTPNTKTITTPSDEVLLTYNGSWMEPMGYISVTSQNSNLAFQLKDFVEAGGKQYAIGVVYNGDVEAGDIVMVR